jgi:hypothetical protein
VPVRMWLVALAVTVPATATATACDEAQSTAPRSGPTTGSPSERAEAPSSSEPAAPSSATEADGGTPIAIEVLGESTAFAPGGDVEPIDAGVSGRECLLSEPLFGSCRAATGAGGAFVVTAEGSADAPGEWTIVARCGLTPAAPGASASGAFTPVVTDLGLAPYGEITGVTLLGPDRAEAALVYQPGGAACPTVWGLGEIDRTSLFTGGTDALNGAEDPLRFRDATGAEACAVADGEGGISVGTPDGADCRT